MLPNEAIQYGKYYIVEYQDKFETEWDDFIRNESVNGCFLQSRRFLNYHPSDRFIDCSLLFYDEKGNPVALCAGCEKYEGENKVFYSHSGSTYGGIIVNIKSLRTETCLAIIDSFEVYLKTHHFSKVLLKQLNPLMCNRKDDLLEFCFYYKEYTEYKELDIYVDYEHYDLDDVTHNFSKLKRRTTRKCLEAGMKLRALQSKEELARFLEILSGNLEKYGLKPYHTVDDLLDLQARFPDEIKYWGCEYEGKIIAVTMVFLFHKSGCIHTHYLASDRDFNKISPMTFVYYEMIDYYKNKGFKTLSWGITTEHFGVEINDNLTNTKEEFGSFHNVVSIFEKEFYK